MSTLRFHGRRQAPLILQTEAAECGLACLAMVAAYHGYDSDLASLRHRYSISLKGTTLAHIINMAATLKLSSRPVRFELDDIDKLSRPAILHWDFNHFVVLAGFKHGQAKILDPARGERRMSLAELSKHVTGIALELTPADNFETKAEHRRMKIGQLLGKPRGLSQALLQIFLLATALEVFGVLSPFYMQLVVDNAVVARDHDLLTVLALGFLLVALIQVAITAIRSWVLMVLGTTLNFQLLGNLFRHLLRLPISFFDKRHLGDIVSRFESLNVVQRTLTTSFIEAIVDGMMALVTFAMLLFYSATLAAIVLAAAAGYGIVRLTLYRPLMLATEEQILRAAKQQTNFLETVRGVQSVKLFNRQLQRRSLYQNLMVETFNASIRVQKFNILYRALNGSLFGIENIIVVWLGALLVLNGGFSVGMLFAFMSYKQQFTSRIINFIEKGIEFRMLGLHLHRISDVALADPEPEEQAGSRLVLSHTGLEVRNLSFRYSDAEPLVLNDVNFTVEPGESVAIVGPSGCGKTTLLKLLASLLQPNEGEILIGDAMLRRIDQHAYRKAIGVVMQDDQLFAGSIADNICFFDPHPDQAFIEHCAQLAAVHTDIAAMPMGYNTLIGDMGTVLSGGQKQRVLLARALYKRPKILFLDEATSHLDVARERKVNEAISQLKLTRIIIAHRPDTIASVDRVIVLAKGTVQTCIRNVRGSAAA